ncbi:MAG: hypothetical protein K2O89_06330 [Clostridia bacterium]|nr:hypothetical protein [Clostridia bacterium]
MDIEKTCENCKFYRKHYTVFKVSLKEVGGHCVHDKILRHNYSKVFTPVEDCAYWQDGTPIKEERREIALKDIREMKRRLDEIALALKVD